ncbi:Hypothetical predicted protein [Cloeon dipterum]|uniref:Ninjurin-1 n=3 Tax=Cloeon dipterum TaxID=197152 RepID=A0A8S1DK35_9INSE|nr:Hypothetical predicted protein [Cloeon dipterum]
MRTIITKKSEETIIFSRIKDGPVLGSFVKQPHSSAPARGESDMVANGNSVTPMDDGAGEDNPGRRTNPRAYPFEPRLSHAARPSSAALRKAKGFLSVSREGDGASLWSEAAEAAAGTAMPTRFQDVVHRTIDANRYASKKTLAQGMLDIALLTANASQLKYILQVGHQHEFYTLMVTLISISIILQVVMGCLALSLNMLRDCRLHQQEYKSSALCLNYLSLSGAFLVSAVNLLIAVFNPRPTHPAAPV